MQTHVLDYLAEAVAKAPERTAYCGETHSGEMYRLSFLEVYEQSLAVGTFLHQKGISQGAGGYLYGEMSEDDRCFLRCDRQR